MLALVEPARGKSCCSGQRRGPAAPGEDIVSSPDQKSFHPSRTPIARGRKWRSLGSISPRTVWKTQPHWLIADWLGLMEPARGESYPPGQRRSPAAPGEDSVQSPDQKSLLISTTPTTRGRKRRSLGSIPPRRVWKTQLHWLIDNWLELMEPASGDSCPSDPRRDRAVHGEVEVPSPDQRSFHISTTSTTRGRIIDPPGRYPPPHGVETPTPLADC